MATYTAAEVYLEDFKDLVDTYWVEYEQLPKPQLIISNDSQNAVDAPIRGDLNDGDEIIFRNDSPEQIRYRGNIHYYDRVVFVTLDMLTLHSRQRLHDIWREIRGICFDRKHNFPNYQLIKIQSYQEMMDQENNIWRGIARVALENYAITVDTA